MFHISVSAIDIISTQLSSFFLTTLFFSYPNKVRFSQRISIFISPKAGVVTAAQREGKREKLDHATVLSAASAVGYSGSGGRSGSGGSSGGMMGGSGGSNHR